MGIRFAGAALATFAVLSCHAPVQPTGLRGVKRQSLVHWQRLFDEVCSLVESHFYSSEKVAEVFVPAKEELRRELATVSQQTEFDAVIRKLLARLETSHTAWYPESDPKHYQLAGIFASHPAIKNLFAGRELSCWTLGAWMREIDGQWFFASVFPKGPAARAGILGGDELVSIDGEPYAGISSLSSQGRPVTVRLRRTADHPPFEVSLTPIRIHPTEEFLAATKASARVESVEGHSVASIRFWSYAGQEFHDLLEQAVSSAEWRNAEGLLWDLRDGWGGASPEYLNLFHERVPSYTRIDRAGNEFVWDTQWRKPVVMLVNGGVRSGKEILAYGFQKHGIGKIVGERTAGAVTAGSPFVLSDGSLLYLAVGAALIDGETLEGVGIEPDLVVPMDIRYRAGSDPQREAAQRLLVEMIEKQAFARD